MEENAPVHLHLHKEQDCTMTPCEEQEGSTILSPLSTHVYGSTTEILPYLWISTTGDGLLQDVPYLKESGIVFVVNCCEKDNRRGLIAIGDHLEDSNGEFTMLHLNLKDDSTQSLTEAFEQFFPIVQLAKETHTKCLILCHSGMSRSVSLVIAYLLTCERMSLIEAFAHVKERRKIASPNPGFMAQLIQLERETRSHVTVDLERYKNDRFGDPFTFAVEVRSNSTGTTSGTAFHTKSSSADVGSPIRTYNRDEINIEKRQSQRMASTVRSGKRFNTSSAAPGSVYDDSSDSSSSSSASSFSSTPTISITPIFSQQNQSLRYLNTDSSTTPRPTITTKNNNKRRGHEREESDISITFTFSFDDAKPKGRSKEVERLHSDVSVKFWEEVTQRKKTPKGPYHSLSSESSDLGMSLPPIFFPQNSHTNSFSSENSPMVRSSIQDQTQYHAQPSLLLSTSTTSDFNNDDASCCCPSEDTTYREHQHNETTSAQLSRSNNYPPTDIVTPRASRHISHPLLPIFQEVSSYVSSFLVCNSAFGDAADGMPSTTTDNMGSPKIFMVRNKNHLPAAPAVIDTTSIIAP